MTRRISITRVFDAPREEVWRAWTEPERIAQWWGKRGWSTPVSSVELDVRPGGVFRLNSINDEDGREMPMDAVYTEVVEPERLAFGTSSVTFADLGDGRTEMRFEATRERRGGRRGRRRPRQCLRPNGGIAMSVDFRLEVIVVPVADVDRAKAFYADQMGFNVDHDTEPNPGIRVVQLTPPGSACSIVIGTGLSDMEPGSIKGLQLVVDDMDAAYELLTGRGVDLGEVVTLGAEGRPGFRHVFFNDPDGNAWTIQEIRR